MALPQINSGDRVTADDHWNPLIAAVNDQETQIGGLSNQLLNDVNSGGIVDLSSQMTAIKARATALETALGWPYVGATPLTSRVLALENAPGAGGSVKVGTSPASGIGQLRATPWYRQRRVAVDALYSGSPGACYYPTTGLLRIVWRQGTASFSVDGVLKTATSADFGKTWSAASTIVGTGSSPDIREPSLAVSADGATTWLTYCKAIGGAFSGAFFRSSTDGGTTWSAERRMDSGIVGVSGIASPVVQVGNALIAGVFGQPTGDTFFSNYMVKSVDGGINWTTVKTHNGQTAGVSYVVPWMVARGNTIHSFFQYGSTGIGYALSTNGGTTWGAASLLFNSGNSKASAVWLGTDTIAIFYKTIGANSHAIRYMRNGSLYPGRTLTRTQPGPIGTLYVAPVEVAKGLAFAVIANEQSTSSAWLVSSYVVDGAGTSPLGDSFQSDEIQAAARADQVLFGDQFAYPNGALPAPWTTPVGSQLVTDGALLGQPAVISHSVVDVGSANVDISADFRFTTNASNSGIIFRYIDANNYWVFVTDTLAGVVRVNKIDGGVTTIANSATWSLPVGGYVELQVRMHGPTCYTYYNGKVANNFDFTGPEQTKYGAITKHGIRLDNATTYMVRRFAVHGDPL